jgi:hypothetical protein
MKKTPPKTNQATTTRNVLSFMLVVVIISAVAGFYYGLQVLREYALDVTHTVTDSSASADNIDQLSVLKKQLADGQPLVAKAQKLFSTPDTYQTQALKDISKYASDAGITISSIDSASPASGNATSPLSPSGTGYSEVITLQNPVSYAKLLQFLDAIEGNLPKMQITGVSIDRPATPSGDQVTTDKITITVAVR